MESTLDACSKLFLASRKTNGKPGLEGAPLVNKCDVKPGKPYTLPFKDPTVNASAIQLIFETIEDAN